MVGRRVHRRVRLASLAAVGLLFAVVGCTSADRPTGPVTVVDLLHQD